MAGLSAGWNPVRDAMAGYGWMDDRIQLRKDREYQDMQRIRAEEDRQRNIRRQEENDARARTLQGREDVDYQRRVEDQAIGDLARFMIMERMDEKGKINDDAMGDPTKVARIDAFIKNHPVLSKMPVQRPSGATAVVSGVVPGPNGTIVNKITHLDPNTGKEISTGPETVKGTSAPDDQVVARTGREYMAQIDQIIASRNPEYLKVIQAARQGRADREASAKFVSTLFPESPAATPAQQPAGLSAGAEGQPTPSSGSARGVRNNNPGNLVKSSAAWVGKVQGNDSRFETFDTPQNGVRALARNLISYGEKGFDTVDKIISRWAPASENNTGAYVKAVSTALGVAPDAKLNLNDPATLSKLTNAIIQHENGQNPYDANTIAAGVNAALGVQAPAAQATAPATAPQSRADAVGQRVDGLRAALEGEAKMPGAALRKKDPAEYDRRMAAHRLARAQLQDAEAQLEREVGGAVTSRNQITPGQPATQPAPKTEVQPTAPQPTNNPTFVAPTPTDAPPAPKSEVNRAVAGLSSAAREANVPSDIRTAVLDYVKATGDVKTALEVRKMFQKDNEFDVKLTDGYLVRYNKKTGQTDIMLVDPTKKSESQRKIDNDRFTAQNTVMNQVAGTFRPNEGEMKRVALMAMSTIFSRTGVDPKDPAVATMMLQTINDMRTEAANSGFWGFFKKDIKDVDAYTMLAARALNLGTPGSKSPLGDAKKSLAAFDRIAEKIPGMNRDNLVGAAIQARAAGIDANRSAATLEMLAQNAPELVAQASVQQLAEAVKQLVARGQ